MPTFRVRGAGSNGLNLREEPGLGSLVVGTLEDGDVVEAEGTTTSASRRDWRRVVSPRVGFVADAYLDPIAEGEGSTPRS
jgi:hypothetical protein